MDVFKLDDSACAVILPATSSTASSPDGKISSDSLSFDSHSDFFYDNSIKKEFDDDPKQCFYEPVAPMTADAVYTKDYGLPAYTGNDSQLCRSVKNSESVMLCETKAELPESSSSPPAHKGKPGRHRSNNGQGMLCVSIEKRCFFSMAVLRKREKRNCLDECISIQKAKSIFRVLCAS